MDRLFEFISNHYMLVLALAVVTFLLIQELIEIGFSQFKSLSPMQTVAYMNSQPLVIIDVREPVEFAGGHIDQAINISVEKLKQSTQAIDLYKGQNLLLVCQSGTRSTQACKQLAKSGFPNLFNLGGGMLAWEDAKLPIRNTKK